MEETRKHLSILPLLLALAFSMTAASAQGQQNETNMDKNMCVKQLMDEI